METPDIIKRPQPDSGPLPLVGRRRALLAAYASAPIGFTEGENLPKVILHDDYVIDGNGNHTIKHFRAHRPLADWGAYCNALTEVKVEDGYIVTARTDDLITFRKVFF